MNYHKFYFHKILFNQSKIQRRLCEGESSLPKLKITKIRGIPPPYKAKSSSFRGKVKN
jgi:hypothetical protein